MKKMFLLAISALLVFGCTTAQAAKKPKLTKEEKEAIADSLANIEAEKYLSIGIDFYRQKKYEEAITYYNRALEEYSNHYKTMVSMAVTYQDMADLGATEEWYRKLYNVYPDSLESFLGLGGVFLKKSSMDEMYLDSAEILYNEGLALYPDESDLYHGVAEVHKRKGGVEAADSIYQSGIQKNPDNLGLRNSYVDFLIDQDRHADAVEHEKYIVDAQPDDPFAWKKLGSIYDELKDCDLAIEAFNKVIELRPDDYDGVMKLGGTYLKCKKYSSAEEAFKKAIEMDSTKLVPHVYLGMTYFNWGKMGSAETEFKYILSQDSDYGDALFFMGAIYAKRAGESVTSKSKDAWVSGCANARTATNFLERSKAADSHNVSRANSYIEYLQKVRNELKKKLILVGITDC